MFTNSLDQSARKLLIYMEIAPDPCGLRPKAESEAGERNAPERAKPALGGATDATGEVRSLSHEPATTRGFWRDQTKKSPNREWLGLRDWWWACNPRQT
jgi:hypothetical protein